MKLSRNFLVQGMLFLAIAMIFTNCKKDDESTNNGTAEFEITDAPIDDTNVKGAFVTVTAVKIDGEVISNFSGAVTIDLLAYQNGNTKALGLGELEAGTYSNVSLVLDYEKDVNGDTPGCYVLAADNTKHSLQSSTNSTSEIIINSGNFEVEENSTTKLVVDFDVRKAIKQQDSPQANDNYDFVTEAELRTSLRMVNKNRTGKVKGKVSDSFGQGGDRIVVYAYKKGTFTQSTETSGQGSSSIMFKNAETSAVVDASGNYNISFLTEGEYELHYVGYEDTNSDGKMEAKGFLEVSALASLNLLGLQLDASAEISVDVTVVSVVPF
ncbi:MAG: hypothetical protein ACJAT4_002996 [Granulosicoccus sp.]|jgi:hypothetical protein